MLRSSRHVNMYTSHVTEGPWYFNCSMYADVRPLNEDICMAYERSKSREKEKTVAEKLLGVTATQEVESLSAFDDKYLSVWKVEKERGIEKDRCAGAIPLRCECLRYHAGGFCSHWLAVKQMVGDVPSHWVTTNRAVGSVAGYRGRKKNRAAALQRQRPSPYKEEVGRGITGGRGRACGRGCGRSRGCSHGRGRPRVRGRGQGKGRVGPGHARSRQLSYAEIDGKLLDAFVGCDPTTGRVRDISTIFQ